MTAIEESVSFLSDEDISFDKTEEELEVTYLRSGRKWKRSLQVAAANAELADVIADANADHASPDRKKKRQSVSCNCSRFSMVSLYISVSLQRSRKERNHRRSRSAGAVISAKLSVAQPIEELQEAPAPTPSRKKHRRSRSNDTHLLRKCNSASSQPAIPGSYNFPRGITEVISVSS